MENKNYFCLLPRNSFKMVRIRAISRRRTIPSFTLRTLLPETPKRKFQRSCRLFSSACCSSFSLFCFNSFVLMALCDISANYLCFDWQFRARLAKRLTGVGFGQTVYFKNYSARMNHRAVSLGVALPRTHSHFSGFRRVGSVGKNANPHLACFADYVRHRLSRGFDLLRTNPRRRERFKAVGAERDFGAPSFHARLLEVAAPRLPLSEFYFFRIKHVKKTKD